MRTIIVENIRLSCCKGFGSRYSSNHKQCTFPSFEEYIQFKESTGFIVNTITTESIYTQYTGQDNQDKIRNCIIDYYETYNIEYVILGGDADPGSSTQNIIPHRGFHANDDSDIPADMYYCCLDGNWNNDGDNKWGEVGEYDLYAEVAIGRICADHAIEVQNFTHKLSMYQNNPVVADIEKALMIGEELNNNPWTFGGDYKDQIAYGSSAHGFTTAAISDNFEIFTLYDRDGGWNKYDVFNQFNTGGLNLLNHLGHSSPTYNMKMNNSDITTSNFQNDGITRGYVIGYSQGCYNGSFDNRDWNYSYGEDCFAEKITTLTTAEVATVANSRYGWYSPGNTNSSSQYIDRQFYDAIFGEDLTIIGYSNSDSKEDNASYFANDSYMRWTAYELNLFGDPSMDIWTAVPTDIVVSIPASMPIGSTEVDFETDAPFARLGILQNGALIGRAVADASGNGTVVFTEPVTSPDAVEISIIAHNKNRYSGSMIVVSNQPYVLFESCQVNDPMGNGNGMVDFGEQISMGMSVVNVGDQPASDVVVTLSSSCEYITITDNTEAFGNMAAGQAIFIDDAFVFDVADDIPNNCPISFIVEATGESTWESEFTLFACAPEFSFGAFMISDPSGNNNGQLDPGETVNLTFMINNTGQSDAPVSLAELASVGNYVTINNSSYDLGTIAAGGSKISIFNITVDVSAPVGSFANLMLEVNSGLYNASKGYNSKIGRIVEDWETGDFELYDWETGGNAEWLITTSNVYEGTYCAKSGDVGDQQFSLLQLSYNVMYDDSISFFVKVSSEADYDYLKFYIDGEVVGQWAGNFGWERVSFAIPEGMHLLKWLYIKDTYVSSGTDCAWVDFIELPTALTTTAFAGGDEIICAIDDFDFNCAGTATNYNTVEWTTSGTGSFDDASLINPVYSPSYDDVSAGSIILTLTVYGADETVSDDMVLTLNQSPEIVMNGNVEICAGSSYFVSNISAQNFSQLSWSTSGDGTFDDITLLEPIYTPGEKCY
ncbi:MAG: C25 family cysteine peptidase [Bacteroidales bacterium]